MSIELPDTGDVHPVGRRDTRRGHRPRRGLIDPGAMSSGPFLIGGGREPEQLLPTHRPFLAACAGGPIVCLVADEGDGIDAERWRSALRDSADGAPPEVEVVVLSAGRPLADADVAGAAGIYVAGGLTPLYAELLAGWTPPAGVPYAGFSAGAAVAAGQALVGGWRTAGGLAVCPEDAGEDLDVITIRPGLGLVPYAVDVHAAQWGTLGRLIHAVESGLVAEGWALDEGALLVDGEIHGVGAGWHVADGGRVRRVTSR
jgi:cyanophycinase